MRVLTFAAIFLMGGLSLATVATSETLDRGKRPTDKIAADLNISEEVFIECFSNVRPDRNHNPSGAKQKANKAVLLPCLQAANPEISNRLLDDVMDRYRPEGPMRRS
ncbi:hypothetical protein [Cognatishimia activa]|uniref:hypothetical protein n=1 Tax=Cognatishimia activa TaxID=1715691 RepID=UPI002230F1F1|nr:hypothetical protein [Cognatishimia activa]UZD90949.1 hypothetical protein M0D42_15445 [Cognatishimia activa]